MPHGHRNALEQVRETSINAYDWLGVSHLPINEEKVDKTTNFEPGQVHNISDNIDPVYPLRIQFIHNASQGGNGRIPPIHLSPPKGDAVKREDEGANLKRYWLR